MGLAAVPTNHLISPGLIFLERDFIIGQHLALLLLSLQLVFESGLGKIADLKSGNCQRPCILKRIVNTVVIIKDRRFEK